MNGKFETRLAKLEQFRPTEEQDRAFRERLARARARVGDDGGTGLAAENAKHVARLRKALGLSNGNRHGG